MKRALRFFLGLAAMLLVGVGAMAQSRTMVTGRVVDEQGSAVSGASVVLTGSPQTGVSSGADGRFQLSVPSLAGSLTVTHVGMDTAVVPLRAGVTSYEVTLYAEVLETGEVIVTGYFDRERDNFTGSAVTVTGEQLRQVNPNNLLQSIQAFDPSFRIAENNLAGSNPNRLPDISVRGSASLPGGAGTDALRRDNLDNSINMPTFILDGYEVGVDKIYDLDMNRVAGISLLKDAAATAIYGSRAANGVLVITTKAPTPGQLRLSASYELTPSFADLSSYDMLGAKEKLQYEVAAGLYDSNIIKGVAQQRLDEEYYKKYRNVLGGIDTDWMAQPVRNALGNKLSLYLEGGDQSLRYGVSGQVQTMPGVMKESSRDRLGLGVDLSYYLRDKVIFKNVLSVTNVGAENSTYGSFRDYVGMNPYYPITDPQTGKTVQNVYEWETGSNNANIIQLNPAWNALETGSFDREKYWEINESFTMEWFIAEGLKFRGQASYIHLDNKIDWFQSPNHNNFYAEPDPKLKGRYHFNNTESNYVDASGTLTYNKRLGERHFINSGIGVNLRTENSVGKTFEAIGFSNDRFTDIGFANSYADGARPTSSADKARLLGGFLSFNYSYDNRYLFDLSGRVDGSSRFGTNNNVAMFWAAGVGWNVHNEKFLQNQSTISKLRVMFNTGLTGSDSSSPYQAKTLYRYNDYWYSTGPGVSVTQYGNDDLKWERTISTDLGLEVGLWEDRVFLSGHYYNKLTKDMLADIAVPTSTGFGYYKDNLGDVRNRGFEVGLKASVLKNDDWSVMLTANLTSNQNRILKISDELKAMNQKADEQQQWDGDDNDAGTNNIGMPLLRFEEGKSLNTIWAVPSMGIDPENGKEIFVASDGGRTYFWHPNDIKPLQDTDPSIFGYFGGSAYYKGFMLSLQFSTTLGGHQYNQTLVDRVENADPKINVDRRALEGRWTTPGEPALYKNIQDQNKTNVSSRFIQRENTLELRSVYLSYDFRPAVYEKLGMKTLRLALTANDLWRASTIELERGVDYPFARSVTFSLQTSF